MCRAYDLELHRAGAVKVPKPGRLDSAEAFMAEARRVARLKHLGSCRCMTWAGWTGGGRE
ncbi:MAG: hypothetical protein EXR98_18005 [Gemmataceae bacterium]|nr:hypothetical protein [Gemmataceae bacterium]